MDPVDSFLTAHLKGGFCQIFSLVLLGLLNLISGTVLIFSTLLLPEIQFEFGLSTTQLSVLSACFQVGQIFGSTAGGELAKMFGRALSIKAFLFMQLCSGLLIYYCLNFYWACALFFIYGVYFGFALSILSVFASEISSVKTRGRWMIFVNSFLTHGRIAGSVLAIFVLKTGVKGSWKEMILILTAGVAFLFPVVLYCLKEPLRYLITKNKVIKFQKTFNEEVWLNNLFLKEKEKGELLSQQSAEALAAELALIKQQKGKKHGSYKELFTLKNFKVNFLVWTIWFGSFAMISGQSLILPFWFGNAAKGLKAMTLIVSAELFVIAAGAYLIDKQNFGRLKGLRAVNLIAAVFFVVSLAVTQQDVMTGVFIFTRFGVKGNFLFLFPYTAEIYTTDLRSRGLGIAAAIGGVASVLTPFVLFPMFEWQKYSIFVVLGGIGFICLLASLGLSKETARTSLDSAQAKERQEALIRPKQTA